MIWRIPPKLKIHEALGCIADKRIEINGNQAKVYSSSREKQYTVQYDPDKKAIMANDNGSYWKEYLGYPSISFLMLKGVIPYQEKYANAFKDIKWKDLNTQYKNDFSLTEKYINDLLVKRGFSLEEINIEIDKIYEVIKNLNIEMLGDKQLPPKGY